MGVTEADILAEVEELGRLTVEQEDILYRISLRQDELGREPTNVLLEKVVDSPVYKPMFEREYLTYDVYNYGGEGSHVVCNLIVTLKGTRYCILFGEEINNRRVEKLYGKKQD